MSLKVLKEYLTNIYIGKMEVGKDITYLDLIEKQACMFFCALKHENAEDLLAELKLYIGDSYYLIGLEHTKVAHYETLGEHFHFIVFDWDEEKYKAFRAKVFITKYQLRGRAKDGKPRQYGKESNIRDLHKACSYTVKEDKIMSNIPHDIIQLWVDESFIRSDKLAKRKELLDYLYEVIKPYDEWMDYIADENMLSKKVNLYGQYFEYIRKETYSYQYEEKQTFFNKSTTETTLRDVVGKVNTDKHICLELIYKLNYNI